MAQNKIGGTIYLKSNGVELRAKGDFTWNLGLPMRTALEDAARISGYKESHQVASIEGEVRVTGDVSVEEIVRGDDLTITLELITGKTIALYGAWFAGDGAVTTEEGSMAVRWEAARAEEITR